MEFRDVSLSLVIGAFLYKFKVLCGSHRQSVGSINVDGAVNLTDGRRSVGAIVCSYRGGLNGAVYMYSPSFVFVLATKLFTLKTGLELAIDAGWFPLIVESDS